jgi:hypothetical protein
MDRDYPRRRQADGDDLDDEDLQQHSEEEAEEDRELYMNDDE